MEPLIHEERDLEKEKREKLESKEDRARVEDFAELLASSLAAQFGYKRNYVTLGLGPTVNARTLIYDLYLRITPPRGPWTETKCLVITRMAFTPSHKGHGRRFITFLVECAEGDGCSNIGIESANEESKAFGEKLGLLPHHGENNLLGSVQEVRARLTEQKV